jgi:hypothetical protein
MPGRAEAPGLEPVMCGLTCSAPPALRCVIPGHDIRSINRSSSPCSYRHTYLFELRLVATKQRFSAFGHCKVSTATNKSFQTQTGSVQAVLPLKKRASPALSQQQMSTNSLSSEQHLNQSFKSISPERDSAKTSCRKSSVEYFDVEDIRDHVESDTKPFKHRDLVGRVLCTAAQL